jgi:hypothetical protein
VNRFPSRVSNSSVPLSVITYWRSGALCHERLDPLALSSKLTVAAPSTSEPALGASDGPSPPRPSVNWDSP